MGRIKKTFLNGLFNENPTFRLVLGTCPTLAVTTQAMNGIGMGLAATFVLIGSNVVISLLRKFIPDKVRIPAFIVIICMFVTVIQMFMQAFVPSLYSALGIFIPLIVVNCIILARAEAFASKNGVLYSAIDGLGMGLGFTCAITLIGAIRELIGNGTIFGVRLLGTGYEPMLIISLAPGGFIVFGLILGLVNYISTRDERESRREADTSKPTQDGVSVQRAESAEDTKEEAAA
ncbi:MAG: electron transport complex subunit E [Christensenellaceae bacterium]|nr:electron transport complex subunit E [Christensenellaceae bacterium]